MVKLVTPKVFKLAETKIDLRGFDAFVGEIGEEAVDWFIRAPKGTIGEREVTPSHAERLIETAGRLCYKSFGVGLNPNITMVRDDLGDYFRNILEKGDGSILEHGTVTFAVLGGSRVFTHELVRHRVGVAYSQESLRYVRPKEIGLSVVPGTAMKDNLAIVEQIEREYAMLSDRNWDGMSFDVKKRVTSLLRRILPQGMATDIIFTANHRTLRWLVEARTHPAAEVEIRYIFDQIAEILLRDYPLIYQDFQKTENPDGTFTYTPTLRSKV